MKYQSGIYGIRNLVNDKVYIGSATNFNIRKSSHFSDLKSGKHFSKHLQSSFNKYGKENFVFEILCYAEKDRNYLLYLEDKFIFYFDATNSERGYNLRKIASSNLGIKFSDEIKQKYSISKMGNKNPNFGKKFSEERKLEMSESRKGEKSFMFGKHKTEEQKIKNGDAHRGSKAGLAKLNESEVLEIKKLLATGVLQKVIMEKFNISSPTVSNIKTGKTWRHVIYDI
jgi:group I intron endonuclease